MDCRVTGMLSISMALTQHYPQTVQKAPPRQSESLGGSHTLLELLVQKQTMPHECIHNYLVQHQQIKPSIKCN